MFTYEELKDNLEVHIYDLNIHQRFLENKVVDIVGDFAVCYAARLKGPNDHYSGRLMFTRKVLDFFGITHEQLRKDAYSANLNRRCGLYHLDEILLLGDTLNGIKYVRNLFDLTGYFAGDFNNPFFMLTEQTYMYGASFILHEEIRKKIGVFMKTDYFVLPSSVHDAIIVPYDPEDVDWLNALVHDANISLFKERTSDILSDKVQWCSRDGKIMMNAEKHEKERKK